MQQIKRGTEPQYQTSLSQSQMFVGYHSIFAEAAKNDTIPIEVVCLVLHTPINLLFLEHTHNVIVFHCGIYLSIIKHHLFSPHAVL